MGKKKVFRYFVLAFCVVLLGVGGVLVNRQFSKAPPVENFIQYKDNISHLKLTHSSKSEHDFFDKNYKLMVYLSKDCSSCLESLPVLEKINLIFCKNQDIKFMLLWDDVIPYKDVDKYGLREESYSLNNVRISSALDTVFIADYTNEVVFVDSTGFENVLNFLIENIIDKDILVESSNQYLLDSIAEKTQLADLIYFSMPGCPDCEDITPIIYSEPIESKFHITRIETEKNAAVTDIKDELNIFKKVYEINWYPTFLLINEDGKWEIIRKLDKSKIEQTILSADWS